MGALKAEIISCRRYQVLGPNTLWYIDEKHKLIYWKFVIHGAIDENYEVSSRAREEYYNMDPENKIDLFCLHFVFQSQIEVTLKEFTCSWNNHKLQTKNNFTPQQLFIRGAIQNRIVLDSIDNIVNLNNYGIDWKGPLSEPEFEQVNINEISNILNS
ncbi:3115_t:CDS:2 [Diversispora eburnea]|uniref:3115_t:CDS:1 n=1 Tax=Diversispora eburnea TaxID=1213867 RepID=A0A9N9A092_9GLOM|nr:3115_t:CDS:2 [Diversispora eburnea]